MPHLVEKFKPARAWKFLVPVISTVAAAPFVNLDFFIAPLCSTQLLPASTFWLLVSKYSDCHCFEADIFFPEYVQV